VPPLRDPFADHPLPCQPLVSCSGCGSGLIYPIDCVRQGRDIVIGCRCPECEQHEVVLTSPLVAAVWRRREEGADAAMHRLADLLAEPC
jgi:hypothetical protein